MSGGLVEIFEKIALGSKNMEAGDQPNLRHRFRSLAFLDGAGSSFTQLYECACGQLYVVRRGPRVRGKKPPIMSTVIEMECPVEHPPFAEVSR